MNTRIATPDDAVAIARIYNQGIVDRVATFETHARSAEDVRGWFDGRHPIVVVEDGGAIVAFASTSTYRPRECYAGIAEFSVYAAREGRRRGAGRAAMQALITAAEAAGFWKLVSRVFPENTASLALLRSLGFREVGVYAKHGRLDGVWRDVVIVEMLIEANVAGDDTPFPSGASIAAISDAVEQANREGWYEYDPATGLINDTPVMVKLPLGTVDEAE